MEPKSRSADRAAELCKRGVAIPNPLAVEIGPEVELDHISSRGVTLYPGCRIAGEKTVISAGVTLGKEGPVTVEDCQLGPAVELKGGYFSKSTFLEKASMALGAHVREGCLLEEEANGAHCVGIKQTILFPFVTLGSLINFCDCLMAGGTSRKDHSEVGSSYIHFNFTPDGDKTTASLIGDVPKGVMLNQPPIFLGGQGGMVGPLRVGYGNTVAAGTILRRDVVEENKLVFGKAITGELFDKKPNSYPSISRVVGANILYLANLAALEQWYRHVRQPFFARQEFGGLVYEGAMDKLSLAKKERIRRLQAMAEKAAASVEKYPENKQSEAGKKELYTAMDPIREMFSNPRPDGRTPEDVPATVAALAQESDQKYTDFIKGLPAGISGMGTQWLESLIAAHCQEARRLMPSLNLFEAVKSEK